MFRVVVTKKTNETSVFHLYRDTGVHYDKLASSTNINVLCQYMREQIEKGVSPGELIISSNKYVNYNRIRDLDLEL